MSALRKFNLFEAMSFIATLVGCLIAVYQIFFSEKMSLQVSMESSISLLQEDPMLGGDIQVLYLGEPVPGISRLDFLILNNGEKSISSSEIVAAPTLHFDQESKVLFSKITSSDPSDVNAKITPARQENSVTIDPGMLNPTDYIRFSVYLKDSNPSLPNVTARIKGLKKIEFIDARPEYSPVKKQLPWTVYPIGFFVIAFALFSVPMFREYRQHKALRRRIKEDPELVSKIEQPEDFRRFIAKMSFAITSEKTMMSSLLEQYSSDSNEINKRRLIAQIEQIIQDTGGSEILACMCPIVILGGASYIYFQLFL
ncbi:hypothetical protein [Pseudomonas oryzicola]|uniref:Type II secretion system protein GspF domain-containing protein n=1 Tax=Pseudomonas oryzicola TaxID=485876 RepID=A0ABS6QFW3_9PSED|nr:hypothetical protein [Pseudomonas oryzicola]MBV4493093.1 hypothetical protein [Pseudomonas oryzicola]